MKNHPHLWLAVFICFATSHFAYSQPNWRYFYSGATVTSIAARGNDILLCSDNGYGFVRFDTSGNATFFDVINSDVPFNYTKQVAIDNAGNWWITHGSGVAGYDGNNWTHWDTTQLGLSFYTSNATVLEASPDGRIGVGTSSRGCAIFENGNWTTLTTVNSGLPSNNIRDITFGGDGKIYFATGSGLAVLDGADWTVFNNSNTGITGFSDCKSVALTASGIVWATTLSRVAKLENGTWTSYTATNLGLSGVGLPGEVIVDEQDRLWLSFSKSVSVLNDTTWTHYLETEIGCTLPVSPSQRIRMAFDGAGQLWSSACGLTRFDGQIWNKFDFATAPPLPKNQIFASTQDAAGNMWFAGINGIAKKEGNVWQAFDPVALGAGAADVYSAHGDALGNVWFGVGSGEILRYDGSDWTLFDTTDLVFPDFIAYWSIASAADGTVWFSLVPPATFASRLARYKNGEWTFFTPGNAPLAPNYDIVGIVVESDGTAWFLANDRLLKYDGANWESFDPTDSGLNYNVLRRLLMAPDSSLWIPTDAGLARFDGATWTTLTTANSDIPKNDIYTVAFDRAGGMYVGYDLDQQGANCAELRGGVWTELLPPGFEPGFFTRPWTFITDRDNRLWFSNWQASFFNGVFVYDPMLVNTNEVFSSGGQIRVSPNPASDVIYLEMPDWTNRQIQIAVRNAQGSLLLRQTAVIAGDLVALELPGNWPAGVYYLEALNEQGERQTGRFLRVEQR